MINLGFADPIGWFRLDCNKASYWFTGLDWQEGLFWLAVAL